MDKNLVREVKNIAVQAGITSLELRNLGLDIIFKEDSSPVTNADKEISNYIHSRLQELTPNIPVICEERRLPQFTENLRKFWLVDPIDGTKSYIENSDQFTINIAYVENNIVEYGYIYIPATKKLYYTDDDKNFVIEENGVIIEHKPHGEEGLVAVVSSYNFDKKLNDYLAKNKFFKTISFLSSIKLCLIAEGSGDVYPKFSDTMEWDIAAGHALIKASGGNVFTLEGQELKYNKKNFLNPAFIAHSKKRLNNS